MDKSSKGPEKALETTHKEKVKGISKRTSPVKYNVKNNWLKMKRKAKMLYTINGETPLFKLLVV